MSNLENLTSYELGEENLESLNVSDISLDNTQSAVDRENEKTDNEKKTKKDALEIIKNGDVVFFFNHLKEFTGLDKEVLRAALKKCKSEDLYKTVDYNCGWIDLSYFEGQVLDNNIAKFLLDTNRLVFFKTLVLNLNKTDGLNESIGNSIILDICRDSNCFKLADEFMKMSHKIKCPPRQLIKNFINTGRLYNTKGIGEIIVNNLKDMKGLSKSDHIYIIDELLAGGFILDILKNDIENLTCDGLSSKDVFLKLVYAGYSKEILEYKGYRAITGLDSNEVLKLIDDGYIDIVMGVLQSQKDLDIRVAWKVMDEDTRKFANCLSSFTGLDRKIANILLTAGFIKEVAHALKHFDNLDRGIPPLLIYHGYIKEVLQNLKQFETLYLNTAKEIIKKGYGQDLLKNLDEFEKLDSEAVLMLIDKGFASEVAQNLMNFGILDENVAIKLIEQGFGYQVINNIDVFRGFDRKRAEHYIRLNDRIIH